MTEETQESTLQETSAPLPPPPDPMESAKKLQEELQRGMPTVAEMRGGQPYIVTRHRQWEERNKQNIIKYQELRQRFADLPSIEELRLP